MAHKALILYKKCFLLDESFRNDTGWKTGIQENPDIDAAAGKNSVVEDACSNALPTQN
jgi:hypothetical protein